MGIFHSKIIKQQWAILMDEDGKRQMQLFWKMYYLTENGNDCDGMIHCRKSNIPNQQSQPPTDDRRGSSDNCCSICLLKLGNETSPVVVLKECGHVFGHKCIGNWLDRESFCPVCQKDATKEDIQILYLDLQESVEKVTRLREELSYYKNKVGSSSAMT